MVRNQKYKSYVLTTISPDGVSLPIPPFIQKDMAVIFDCALRYCLIMKSPFWVELPDIYRNRGICIMEPVPSFGPGTIGRIYRSDQGINLFFVLNIIFGQYILPGNLHILCSQGFCEKRESILWHSLAGCK